jgi:hypothetical protein
MSNPTATSEIQDPFDDIVQEQQKEKSREQRNSALHLQVNSEGFPCPVPEGKYQAEIVNAGVFEHKDLGHDMVLIELEVINGEFAGKTLQKWYHLVSEKVTEFLKKELAKLGFDVVDRDQLKTYISDLLGKTVEVDVRITNGSPAFYISRELVNRGKKIDPKSVWGK